MGISLRRASVDDSTILFQWRNDALTRAASHNKDEITREEHEEWFKTTLVDRNKQLYIAEENGIALGTVRADFDSRDGCYELSWTVAPKARARGVGNEMVALFVNQLKGPVKATIKRGNLASVIIAERCGMKMEREENGLMYYRRPSKKNDAND